MTMVTVPLEVLIGAALVMLATGAVYAADNDNTVEYIVLTIISISMFVLAFCGAKVLVKVGGA